MTGASPRDGGTTRASGTTFWQRRVPIADASTSWRRTTPRSSGSRVKHGTRLAPITAATVTSRRWWGVDALGADIVTERQDVGFSGRRGSPERPSEPGQLREGATQRSVGSEILRGPTETRLRLPSSGTRWSRRRNDTPYAVLTVVGTEHTVPDRCSGAVHAG